MQTSAPIDSLTAGATLSEPARARAVLVNTLRVCAVYGFCLVGAALLLARINRVRSVLPGPVARFIADDSRVAAIFAVAGLAFIAFARLPSLQYAVPFNPDEAQLSADALLVRQGALNWDRLDGTSSGPLNSIVLAWPYLFDIDVTLTTARITGTCLMSLLCVLSLATIRRVSSVEAAIVGTFPLFLFSGATTFHDFVHFSSEQLPLLLIVAAVYCFSVFISTKRSSTAVIAAFALGLVPYCKLQAIPIAAVTGAALVAFAIRSKTDGTTWRLPLVLIAAAMLPTVVFLLPLLVTGSLDDFLNSYLFWAGSYVTSSLSVGTFLRLVRFNQFFFSICVVYGCLCLLSLILLWRARPQLTVAQRWMLAVGFASAPVAYVCIVITGRSFTHYLLLVLPTLALVTGLLIGVALGSRTRMRLTAGLYAYLLAAIFLIPEAEEDMSATRGWSPLLEGLSFSSPHLLSWMRPTADDHLLVWGWMPDWYLLSGITPATRETQTYNQITPSRLRPYFRERLLSDLKSSHPDFIADAVAPGSFWFSNPSRDSVASFPALAEIVDGQFTPVSTAIPADPCPRIYVRRERLAAINAALIPIARVLASAEDSEGGVRFGANLLNDGNVFETCADHWLLPPGTVGSATLELTTPERVATVGILNTRHGQLGDHWSELVRIVAARGDEVVYQADVTLRRYPQWTYHRLNRPVQANAIRIEVLTYGGRGGGLNEVKLFRD